ncbi:hypothetical protein FNL39_101701 [Nocardia caishijiensis]|uniref:Uncharacterized protein n=1 Tax=Nocardia caishijiensis TaxID=184756 RepID=A0ABQ6YTX6_9NOCA|nr:hypothetical protein FNL39_101701 [Nocardia caishijiensis]
MFSGFGACVAAVLFLAYSFLMMVEGMPDEDVSAGSHALLVTKLVVAALAGAALLVGAVSGWRWAILGGCLLFAADFMLWLVWASGVFRLPSYEHPEPGPVAQPPLFWLVLVTVWGVFPGLLAALAWQGRHKKASPHPGQA